MGAFRQLGDPVCPVCLCEHHGVAYAELEGTAYPSAQDMISDMINDGATIVQTQITTTETCCVVVNAATVSFVSALPPHIEIERPLGTPRTMQEDAVTLNTCVLLHHASWEVLAPGTYDYFLVNRKGSAIFVFGAWIKAIASDCEG